MVERLWLYTSVRKMIDDGSYDPGLGLVNLLPLARRCYACRQCQVPEVEQVEAALMDATWSSQPLYPQTLGIIQNNLAIGKIFGILSYLESVWFFKSIIWFSPRVVRNLFHHLLSFNSVKELVSCRLYGRGQGYVILPSLSLLLKRQKVSVSTKRKQKKNIRLNTKKTMFIKEQVWKNRPTQLWEKYDV